MFADGEDGMQVEFEGKVYDLDKPIFAYTQRHLISRPTLGQFRARAHAAWAKAIA